MPADDRGGDDWDPRQPPSAARVRRWKRRLKAAASIGLALAAGSFLTLVGERASRARGAPNPTTPELHDPNAPPGVRDATPPEPAKDKPKRRGKKRRGKVDKDEHRKGMPVKDNLLE